MLKEVKGRIRAQVREERAEINNDRIEDGVKYISIARVPNFSGSKNGASTVATCHCGAGLPTRGVGGLGTPGIRHLGRRAVPSVSR